MTVNLIFMGTILSISEQHLRAMASVAVCLWVNGIQLSMVIINTEWVP